jgi:hypothetical protein
MMDELVGALHSAGVNVQLNGSTAEPETCGGFLAFLSSSIREGTLLSTEEATSYHQNMAALSSSSSMKKNPIDDTMMLEPDELSESIENSIAKSDLDKIR